ncbi:MAG: hypothetical protein ABEJ05_01800 [Haloglomus sp.]
MSSSSQDSERERYPTVGPEAAAYEGYGDREDADGRIRVYETDHEAAGAWLASTVVLSRPSMR